MMALSFKLQSGLSEGGCSAPSAGSDGESVDLGKIRVRVDEIRNYEDPLLTEVQIKHPNESGLSMIFHLIKLPVLFVI